jgi:CBS-domain-containing membrane protein
VITDRDIAMATYTKGRAPGEILVADAMAKEIFTCRASDSIGVAEWLMAEHRIRRLPVVDAHGHAVGVLSMNDLVRDAQKSKNDDRQRGIVQTLAAICAPRLRATEPESAPLEPHTHA